jgi:membrane protein CcdC involved in cytochrome C biogenesis
MSIALTGVVMVLMATLGGIAIVRHKSSEQPIQVKIVLFGLYFWGLAFLQLVVFGLLFYWAKA